MAWLLAIPKTKDAAGKEIKLPARMEQFKQHKADPPLPELTARYLFDWLMEAGPAEAGAMGQAPISWTTIRNWAVSTFQRPLAWEARLLRRLSAEYLSELHLAEDSHRPAPWAPVADEVDQEAAERQLRAVLG